MQLVINGQVREIETAANVAELVASLGMQADRVALERNGEIVARAEWPRTPVNEGDRFELVHFVGGGAASTLAPRPRQSPVMHTQLPFHPALKRHGLILDPPMTDAELERFIRLNEPARIERFGKGLIQMNGPSGGDTSSSNSIINTRLTYWWLTHRRGRVFDSNGGFYLPDGSLLAPDAAYLTAESFATLSKADRKGYYRICPEFILELRSPSDRLGALKKKMELWVANGIQLGWLVNPGRRQVLVYTAGAAQPEVVSGPEIAGSGPVEGFRLNLEEVWNFVEPAGQLRVGKSSIGSDKLKTISEPCSTLAV